MNLNKLDFLSTSALWKKLVDYQLEVDEGVFFFYHYQLLVDNHPSHVFHLPAATQHNGFFGN